MFIEELFYNEVYSYSKIKAREHSLGLLFAVSMIEQSKRLVEDYLRKGSAFIFFCSSR